jgi:carbon monoxide dehydrogenase subunit G
MSRYALTSQWHVDAPIDAVWNVLQDVAGWRRWWSYVLEVEELERGGPGGIGAVHRLTWGTTFPYLLTFTMRRTVSQRPQLMESIFEGDLHGVGRWTLTPHGNATEVSHDWDVTTPGTWMSMMSPLLGPMFRWNHGLVMADGAQGLARHFAARG